MKNTKLLHDITQKGYEISFNSDTSGMILVSYKKESSPEFPNGKLIKNEHLSELGSSIKKLNAELYRSLNKFYENMLI